MKVLATITLRGSHKPLRVGSIRSPAACRGWPSAAGHSFRNAPTIIGFAITRVGKAKRAHVSPTRGSRGHGAKSRLCPPYVWFHRYVEQSRLPADWGGDISE